MLKRFLLFLVITILVIFLTDLPAQDEFDALRGGLHIIFDVDKNLNVRDYIHTIPVPIDHIPKHLQQAVIAIEDHRFYWHPGIDPISLGGTLFEYLTKGSGFRGASTLTQQVAKNLFLSPEQTLARKFREALISIKLEFHYPKDDILEMYLNHVYFGNRAYGVEAAARRYFGKRATEVNLYEAAILAAALKLPNRINLINAPEQAHQRALLVLKQMVRRGFISEKQLNQAIYIGVNRGNKLFRDIDYQYFKDWIAAGVKASIGRHKGRIRVITTLDSELQIYGELALRRVLERSSQNQVSQGALLAMSPDGAIRAMVGGVSFGVGTGKSTFNRATQARRQLGSTFKPIVYLRALQNGYVPSDRILDAPFSGGKDGLGNWPRNYDGRYYGTVTLEEALARSLNGATVHLIDAVGTEKVAQLAEELGIKSTLDPDIGLALGICEASLLEIVKAYAVFASHGEAILPYGIIGILDEHGKPLYWRKAPEPVRLIDKEHLTLLNRMLTSAIIRGTGRQAAFADHPTAGKTGTTQNHRDAWFVGYTAHLVTGVWVGNDDATPMKAITGGELPALVWRNFMANAHLGLPIKPLPGIELSPSPGLGFHP